MNGLHPIYCLLAALLLLGDALSASDLFDVDPPRILAGGGIGEGAAAQRVSVRPQDVAVGPDGRVYIADEQYNRVRAVAADGTVSTVVGSGRYGFDGAGRRAEQSALQVPASVAFGPDGRLYMVDLGNRLVRVVAADGTLHTVFGEADLPAMPQRFAPYDLDVDGTGRVYVADRGNHVVWRWADGAVTRFAGAGARGFGGDEGPAMEALLADPRGVAVAADGAVYIADTGNGRVRRVGPEGGIETWTGSGQALDWSRRILAWHASIKPVDVAVDDQGRVLIADGLKPRLLRHEPDFMLVVLAEFAQGAELMSVAVDGRGDYLVGDYGLRRVWRVGREADGVERVMGDGTVRASGDGGRADNASLNQPLGVAYDAAGNLYIADRANHLVRRVGADGHIERVAGTGVAGFAGDGGSAQAAQLHHPSGVAFDAAGNLYIADEGNHRVRLVDADGRIQTVAGTGAAGFGGDGGQARAAQLAQPVAVATAGAALFIADAGNGRVRRVDVDGRIQTVAGGGYDRDGNGPALQTALAWPVDVHVAADGALLVVDMGVHRLYRLGANGLLRVVAGSGAKGAGADGSRAVYAALDEPFGVLPDGAGGAYLADAGNGRIVHVGRGGVLRVIAEGLGRPTRLALGSGGLVFADADRHRVEALALVRRVAPVAGRVEVAAGYAVAEVAALPVPGPLEVVYAADTDVLYATHKAGIAAIGGSGDRTHFAHFAARSYRVLPRGAGLLVGTPTELKRPRPLTEIGAGPVYLPVELGFGGADGLAWSGAVYVHEVAGRIRRLSGRTLVDYAQVSPGAALIAGAGDGVLYVAHRQSRALLRLEDVDGDGLVLGPGEVQTLTFVDGAEPVALAFAGGRLFVGTDDGQILRLDGRALVPFATGFAPALLSLSAGSAGSLYALEGDGAGGRILHLAPSAPEIAAWPRVLDFGALPLGAEVVREIVLRNDGSAPVVLALDAPADVQAADEIALAPGQALGVPVRFVPRGPEPLAATLVWRDARGRPALHLSATGDVQSPELGATAELDFGVVEVGRRGTGAVVLRNEGRAPLRIERATASAGYAVGWTGPLNLAPGATVRLPVELAADARRVYDGALTLFSNDPFKPVHEIALSGAGGLPGLGSVPEAIDLGEVLLGAMGRTRLTIDNAGEVPLVVDDILTGSPLFIVSPRQVIVPPGEQRTLRLDFRPRQYGPLTGQLRFVTNDPARPAVAIPFTGLGLSALLDAPRERVFGEVALGERATATVLLQNFADRPVRILGVETRNGQFAANAPRQVVAGGQGAVRVEYRPTRLGKTRGALLLRTDLAEAPLIEIALAGSGRVATELEFGPAPEALAPGAEFDLVLSGRDFVDLGGLALEVALPGDWVEFLGLDFAGGALAGEKLVVADRRGDRLAIGVSVVGAAGGLEGDGVIAALRFRVSRPQAGSIALRSAVLRTTAGREDSLAVDSAIALRPAGDFDGSGGLGLADFFALADRLGQGPAGDNAAYDLNGDGRIDLADADVLLGWLGPAGKGVAVDAALAAGWTGAYPNPFNAEVALAFALPRAQRVELDIYNVLGQPVRRLREGVLAAGAHRVAWDGRDGRGRALTSGLYLAVLRFDGGRAVHRLTLVR